jgi:predicted transcriptional regulator
MKVVVRSDGFDAYKTRALARSKKLARREVIAPEATVTFESPLAMLEVLTAERIRLCKVARKQNLSISALASALKRDSKSVRRDVIALERAGVLRTREEVNPGHGRVRIVEPLAERFELRAWF